MIAFQRGKEVLLEALKDLKGALPIEFNFYLQAIQEAKTPFEIEEIIRNFTDDLRIGLKVIYREELERVWG